MRRHQMPSSTSAYDTNANAYFSAHSPLPNVQQLDTGNNKVATQLKKKWGMIKASATDRRGSASDALSGEGTVTSLTNFKTNSNMSGKGGKYGTMSGGSALSRSMRYAETWLYGNGGGSVCARPVRERPSLPWDDRKSIEADPYDLVRRSRLWRPPPEGRSRAKSSSPPAIRKSILECDVNPYDLITSSYVTVVEDELDDDEGEEEEEEDEELFTTTSVVVPTKPEGSLYGNIRSVSPGNINNIYSNVSVDKTTRILVSPQRPPRKVKTSNQNKKTLPVNVASDKNKSVAANKSSLRVNFALDVPNHATRRSNSLTSSSSLEIKSILKKPNSSLNLLALKDSRTAGETCVVVDNSGYYSGGSVSSRDSNCGSLVKTGKDRSTADVKSVKVDHERSKSSPKSTINHNSRKKKQVQFKVTPPPLHPDLSQSTTDPSRLHPSPKQDDPNILVYFGDSSVGRGDIASPSSDIYGNTVIQTAQGSVSGGDRSDASNAQSPNPPQRVQSSSDIHVLVQSPQHVQGQDTKRVSPVRLQRSLSDRQTSGVCDVRVTSHHTSSSNPASRHQFNDTMRLTIRQSRPDSREVQFMNSNSMLSPPVDYKKQHRASFDNSEFAHMNNNYQQVNGNVRNLCKRKVSPGRPRPKEPPPPPPPLPPPPPPPPPPRQIFPFTKEEIEHINHHLVVDNNKTEIRERFVEGGDVGKTEMGEEKHVNREGSRGMEQGEGEFDENGKYLGSNESDETYRISASRSPVPSLKFRSEALVRLTVSSADSDTVGRTVNDNYEDIYYSNIDISNQERRSPENDVDENDAQECTIVTVSPTNSMSKNDGISTFNSNSLSSNNAISTSNLNSIIMNDSTSSTHSNSISRNDSTSSTHSNSMIRSDSTHSNSMIRNDSTSSTHSNSRNDSTTPPRKTSILIKGSDKLRTSGTNNRTSVIIGECTTNPYPVYQTLAEIHAKSSTSTVLSTNNTVTISVGGSSNSKLGNSNSAEHRSTVFVLDTSTLSDKNVTNQSSRTEGRGENSPANRRTSTIDIVAEEELNELIRLKVDPVEAVRKNLVPHVCGLGKLHTSFPTQPDHFHKGSSQQFRGASSKEAGSAVNEETGADVDSPSCPDSPCHSDAACVDDDNVFNDQEDSGNVSSANSSVPPIYATEQDKQDDEVEVQTLYEENHYESLRDPIYEEIPDTPPPLPLSPPPPLRSIFEGATKYDILSYLVGAKERVKGDTEEDEEEAEADDEREGEREEGAGSPSPVSASPSPLHSRVNSLDLSSRISQLSHASDSSDDSCTHLVIGTAADTSSISSDVVRKSSAEIERNDSGVGSETSKCSRTRWQHLPVSCIREDQQHSCEDCEQPVETQVTDSGLMFAPLVCRKCAKRRTERREIITEIVETEEKYGRDLRITLDEFYKPMLVAGLLTQEQLSAIFLNTEELLEHNAVLAEKLRDALEIALDQGDEDLLTVNIGRLFLDATPMLHAFESYCTRQGAASMLLTNLEKEKELLRIFLRVSQMENTVLRRMNLNSFLMVPVQRVTKYPLLLARLYKVTPSHHVGREMLKDAQQNIELHLEHMNSLAKDISSTKLWRRISIMNGRRSSSENDMINIKLRKIAVDVLEWNHDEVRFTVEGRLLFTQPTDSNWRRGRTIKLTPVNAILVTLGKPNEDYQPDCEELLAFPRKNGIKEASLILLKEKSGRYALLRDPLFLDRCIVCMDADWEDCFEVQELATKDTFIFKAEDVEQTRRWYRSLQYHAQGLGAWRRRRCALANIMINGMQVRA